MTPAWLSGCAYVKGDGCAHALGASEIPKSARATIGVSHFIQLILDTSTGSLSIEGRPWAVAQ